MRSVYGFHRDACPECGCALMNSKSDTNTQPIPPQDTSRNPGQIEATYYGSILLSTMPERRSFMYKYLMALSPVILVIACIFIRSILENLLDVASSTLTSAVPGTLAVFTADYLNQYSAPINDATNISILMVAPVGIFIIFAAIGWTMRLTELWTGTALTLVLSGSTAFVMATMKGYPLVSSNFMLLFLRWIAFLVQPFCIVAVIIVLIATEKFRRSLRYTITKDGLWLRGGFLNVQEHMIPHTQIGRIVFEQDFFGRMYNYGTIIPHSMTRWGAETSFRTIGASGQKDNFGVGIGFAKGREEGSRYPLDCLYGIPDPKVAQNILTGLICRQDKREEDQVSYLKKIYENNGHGSMTHGSGIPLEVPTAGSGSSTDDDTGFRSVERIGMDGELPGRVESAVIRNDDRDIPVTSTGPVTGTTREIPPLAKNKSTTLQEIAAEQPVLDQIKKLAELRDAGIITEEEFTAKKTELLRRV